MKLSLKNATSSILTKQVSPFGVTTTFPNKNRVDLLPDLTLQWIRSKGHNPPTLNVPLKVKTIQCFYWWEKKKEHLHIS